MPRVPSSKPKRSHNFTSCNRCRSKRRRCDGVAPSRATAEEPTRSCSSCTRLQQECSWSGEQDHRLPPSHRFVESLQTTIGILEQKVHTYERRLIENGLSTDFEGGDDGTDPNHSDVLSDGSASDVDGVTGPLGKLVIDHKTTIYYGGPAPFRDLPTREEGYDSMNSGLPPNAPPSHHDGSVRYQLCKSADEVLALDPQSASDWLRFLPGDTASILPRLEHDLALARYFTYFSCWGSRVIPDLFLRDFALATSQQSSHHRHGARSPVRHYSAVFHNAILSVALAYSDNVHLRSREIRDRFAKHAKFFLEAECQAPALSTVQALATLSSYHSGFSEQGLGFMYFGMGVRMGQALGLNVWVRNGAMSKQEVVERNWVFWSLFCQDKCWSLYVGRDQGLRYRHFEIPEPEVDPVPQWDYSMPDPNALNGETNAIPVSRASAMSVSFLWQVKLMKIASSIMDVVYGMTGVSRRGIDLAQVAQLHVDLRTWERALPRQMHIPPNALSTSSSPPDVFMLNLAFHWLLILLLRPFFKPHTTLRPPASSPNDTALSIVSTKRHDSILLKLQEAALSECPSSATHIVSLFNAYRDLYTLRLSTVTAIQIAYIAGKIHLATILGGGPNPSAKSKKARGEFLECVQILREIGESWTSGRVTADMLETLLQRGEGRMQQNMITSPPQVGVRVYDPPPYPPPSRSSGITMSAPVIDFRKFGLAIDDYQAPSASAGPSNSAHQSNSSAHRMDAQSQDYQGSPTAFSNNRPSNDHHPGTFDLWAPQGQQQQPAGSGIGSPPMPIPRVSHHQAPSEDLHSSTSPSNIWSHSFSSSFFASAAWMHDGQAFPDQPSSHIYTSSPCFAALQAPSTDENDRGEQYQHMDSCFVDTLDLQDGGNAEHGRATS